MKSTHKILALLFVLLFGIIEIQVLANYSGTALSSALGSIIVPFILILKKNKVTNHTSYITIHVILSILMSGVWAIFVPVLNLFTGADVYVMSSLSILGGLLLYLSAYFLNATKPRPLLHK